jgi:hypothetical protein
VEVLEALLGEGEGRVGGMKPPGSFETVSIFGSADAFNYESKFDNSCP